MNLFEVKFNSDSDNKLSISEHCFSIHDQVVVVYGHTQVLATVTELLDRDLDATEIPVNALKIMHLASADERSVQQRNQQRAAEALTIAQEKAESHDLKMKLIKAEYSLDNRKLIFYFTADKRVDFRQLVRDLAAIYKTRIELRQIGVRDEARILGGIGPCGRQLCCSTFLGDFVPVSIKMAKDQNLSLNPAKISGLCGRLMCCLQYEDAFYEEAKAKLPDYGDNVVTAEGKGRVVGINFLADLVKVQLENHSVPVDYAGEEVKVIKA